MATGAGVASAPSEAWQIAMASVAAADGQQHCVTLGAMPIALCVTTAFLAAAFVFFCVGATRIYAGACRRGRSPRVRRWG